MAAKAPRPGVGKRKDAESSAQVITKISFRGSEPLSLAFGNLPMREKMQVQFQTDRPLEYWWGKGWDNVSSVSFAVAWWLARRANGERNLAFDEVLNEMDGAAIDDFVLVGDDGSDSEDPEA